MEGNAQVVANLLPRDAPSHTSRVHGTDRHAKKKNNKNTSESAILQTLSPGQTYCVKPPLAPARNGTRCVDQVWIQES